jgi:CheY-like chemotaxis protein
MTPRILIANRDIDTQEILCAALQHAGYRAHALQDLDDLVEEASGCALVITDHPIVVRHARTVTRMLRENPRTAEVPILNATTHALPDELAAARRAGVSESIVLPVRLDTIVDKVHTMVGGRHDA